MTRISSSKEIKNRLSSMFDDLLGHNGYGQIQIDMRLLRRGQKEIILRCGKEYRFVVEFPG
jgi:RNase P/RNase MRP subunit POP5